MKLQCTDILRSESVEITFVNNRIQSISQIESTCSQMLLAPALIDIQVNGFSGCDLNVPNVTGIDVCKMVRALWQVGTGFLCPTIVTASFESISNSLRGIVEACRANSAVAHSILGIHLEGPYISSVDGPRGAHPIEHIREPNWDEFRRFQDNAEGMIRIVTIAPEKIGAIPFIEKLVAEGIVVAIGHTDASAEEIREAISAGAMLSTHLGNGAHANIRRHPNYIWEQLGSDELWASLIVDGHHLPSTVVKSMIRAKTLDRSILISDAVALAGMKPGNYQFAGQPVKLTADRCVRLQGTEYLAGSAIELARGIENSVQFAGISLADAFSLATLQPQKLLGLDNKIDNYDDSTKANMILFNWNSDRFEIDLAMTVLNGEIKYQKD